MSNYTPSKVYINKERQQIAMDNASDDSARYTSSDDSERIRNKKDKVANLVAANASSTSLAVIAHPTDDSKPSSVPP